MKQQTVSEIFTSKIFSSLSLWVSVAAAVLLVIISKYNFLLFHSLAEFFAIVIAVLMFVVAWIMYPFTKNNYLMYLGCGYFWIAVLDLLHTLSYKGLNVYAITGANTSTQFWISTRFLEAFILLSAPWFLSGRLNYRLVLALFGVVTAGVTVAIMAQVFPVTYIEGQGLTNFKVYSEYLIITMLFFAIVNLWKYRQQLDMRIVRFMVMSLVLTMASELAFTFYVSIYDLSNLAGHILKFFSYGIIFSVMVKTILRDPYAAMSRGANTYDAVPDAIVLVGNNGIIYQANQAACMLAGKLKSQLIGSDVHQEFHAQDQAQAGCVICNSIANGGHLHGYEMKSNDRWIDYSLSPVTDILAASAMVQVMHDVTHRKQIEQSLDNVSELKDSIVDNLPAILFVKDAENLRYIEWNKAAEDLIGIGREEMLGKSDYDLFPEREANLFTSMDRKVLSEGILSEIAEETIHTRNKGVRLLNTRKIPILNKDGEPCYLLGISQDITEKKATEEMLRRSQKMEAVGQLSGGIAHDFNNQLGIVTGYLEFLKAHLQTQEKQLGWVEKASKAAQRCIELTKQLLIFSRTKSADTKVFSINEVIHQNEDMIAKSVTPEVTIEYQLEKELWPVTVNPGDLEDAIVNMVINSRDAMKGGGSLFIRTSNIYLDSDFMILNPSIREGYFVLLEIEDTGDGMTQEMLEHIFEPFYTTKPVGKGTGLGLSMVYAFVERNGGVIRVESAPGKGTCIRIYLPRSSENYDAEFIQEGKYVRAIKGGDETLLIVDDEAGLLELACEYGRDAGYHVLQATDTAEALRLLAENKVDLLFSDVVMPGGMSGYELAAKAKSLFPELKVLLTSGFADKEMGRSPQNNMNNKVLTKPYTRTNMTEALRKILDEK